MSYESESLLVNGDPNDSKQSANLIKLEDWLYGSLSSVDDVDYFKFTLSDPGLIKLQFNGGAPTRSALSWNVDLMDANLDFVRTLSKSATGTLTASKVDNNNKAITVSGITAAAKVGDQFTVVSSQADSIIYKVVEATALQGGSQTLTLNLAWPSSLNDASILFDPARLAANGASSSLNAAIDQSGTYYLKVSSAAYTDSSYGFRLGFDSAAETDLNGTKEQAVSENNRMVADLMYQGAADTSDADVWLLSTAQAGAFTLDFAPGINDSTSNFNVQIQTWTKVSGNDVLTEVRSLGSTLGGSVTGAYSYSIDSNTNNNATSFVVTITSTSLKAGGTGAYTLKASGAGLDVNDAPLIQMGSYTSGAPDQPLDLTSLVNLAVGSGKQLSLSNFISASDADSQTLTYKLTLLPTDSSAATGSIMVKQDDDSFLAYTNGESMTAADLAKAFIEAGSGEGTLNLDIQAFDSTGLPDNSGNSSLVQLRVNVVSSAAALLIDKDTELKLTEGVSLGSAGYEEVLSFTLAEAPGAGETVTLKLTDTDKQLQLVPNKTVFTFNDDNYNVAQTIKVRALNDLKVEGSHTGQLRFALASNSSNSAYTGLLVDPLTFVIADPSNTAATGTLSLSPTASLEQGDTLTVNTSSIADVDGLGVFGYLWQFKSSKGAWTDIANASEKTFTLSAAEGGGTVQVVVSFVDGKGNIETLTSSATDEIASSNVAPTSDDASLSVPVKSAFVYHFKPSDFPFADLNIGDALASVTLLNITSDSPLKYDGKAITPSSQGLTIERANINKLTLTVPAGKSVNDVLTSVDFEVSDSSGGSSPSQNLSVIASEWLGIYDSTSASNAELVTFSAYAKSTDLNARMASAVGLDLSFTLTGTSTQFDLLVDSTLDANGYWVKDPDGYWTNLATSMSTAGQVTTLSVKIEDGSKYDSNSAQYAVSESGVVTNMPLSVVGITPDASPDGHWF
jgi:hypothetical protein